MTPPPPTDPQALLALARAGGAEAFGELVRDLRDRLWRSARVMCGDDHQSEDLAQETMLEAWKSISRFDGRCALSTWMHGILRHRFLKSVRRAQSRPILHRMDDPAREVAGMEACPAEQARQADDSARLRAAVASLPPDQRAVVEMRFFAEASLQDIAAALDCPEGTVKSRLHHGLLRLRILPSDVNLLPAPGESGARP